MFLHPKRCKSELRLVTGLRVRRLLGRAEERE